jgi:trans-aconitate 2-methyltransferase
MTTQKQYDWNAEDYAKHSAAQHGWARELIAKLKLKGDESVLDIGCGHGTVTAEIASRLPVGSVVGIDSSSDMIALARDNFPRKIHPNLSFQCADARSLPFSDQFDIVFSNAALHWLKDHRPVISGIKRSLKANGKILLQMGGKGNAQEIISTMGTFLSESEWGTYFSDFEFPFGFYDAHKYTLWLQAAGLDPVRAELIPKDMCYDSKEGLIGWMRTTWLPYTERIPVHRREEFISQFVDQYIQKHPSPIPGQVVVKMVRLEVEAINRPS